MTTHNASTTGDARQAAVAEEQAALTEADERRRNLKAAIAHDLQVPVDARDNQAQARATSLRRRLAELEHADTGLIFGRLDGGDGTVYRVGRVGIDAPQHTRGGDGDDPAVPLVIDWRSPAARPFYTATPLDPQGIRRRRHIRTTGATVTGVDDEALAARDGASGGSSLELVGEGALLDALAQRRTGTMGTAVATLQREQDDIVRATPDGPMVVQGGPGTGKTVVALHRVAYLLFSAPQVGAGGVLVLGPSRRFLDYISQVLPALGESAVVSTTIDELLPGVTASRGAGAEQIEIQGRATWRETVTRWCDRLVPDPGDFPALRWEGETYSLPVQRIRRERDASLRHRSHHEARGQLSQRLHDALVDAVVERAEAMLAGVEEGFEEILSRVDASLAGRDDRGVRVRSGGTDIDGTLTEVDIDRIRERIGADGLVDDAVTRWWPIGEPADELRRLLGDDEALADYAPWLSAGDRAVVTRAAAEPGWSVADVPLLDAVGAQLGQRTQPAADVAFTADRAAHDPAWLYGHVVVDEAQELSPMQWQMVIRRCPNRSITAVGDLDQAQSPHAGSTWADSLAGVLGDRWRERELTICYRTPQEVMRLTEPVLCAAGSTRRPPTAVRTSGRPPQERAVPRAQVVDAVLEEAGHLLDRWRDGSGGTVAIIAAEAWVETLVSAVSASRGQAQVVSAADAKGLEWDAVVVVDPDAIAAEPRGWNRLYVALTRCTQELVQIRVTETVSTAGPRDTEGVV